MKRRTKDIVGFALVKNEQSNNGLLALNIGVIDPGYEGPIASTLINFSPRLQRLGKGEPFLRVSFYKVSESKSFSKSVTLTRAKYLEKTRRDVVNHSSPTFLNLDRFVDQASRLAFGRFESYLKRWVPIAALAAVFVTIFVPVLVEAAFRWMPMLSIKDQISRQTQQHFEETLTQLKDLKRRVSNLESAQNNNSDAPPPDPGTGDQTP